MSSLELHNPHLKIIEAEQNLQKERERIEQDPIYLAARIALANAVSEYNMIYCKYEASYRDM